MKWVPLEFQFSLEDPSATEILGARLRANYWGAEVIMYRLVIRHILNFSHNGSKAAARIDPEIVHFACKGTKVLVESTRTFLSQLDASGMPPGCLPATHCLLISPRFQVTAKSCGHDA